jgi:hypothetical protein
MLYVILNDGETYTTIQGSVIFDSVTQKIYSIKKRRELHGRETYAKHEKGILDILDVENMDTDTTLGT